MSASTNPPGVQTSPSRISKSNFSIWRYSPFLFFGNCVCRLLKKTQSLGAKNRSFDSAQDRLGGGVLRQYVLARRLSATKLFSQSARKPLYDRQLSLSTILDSTGEI